MKILNISINNFLENRRHNKNKILTNKFYKANKQLLQKLYTTHNYNKVPKVLNPEVSNIFWRLSIRCLRYTKLEVLKRWPLKKGTYGVYYYINRKLITVRHIVYSMGMIRQFICRFLRRSAEKYSFCNRYNMHLNFKKNRFFPYLDMIFSKKVIFNSSLGIFSRRFSHKKSFLKSKGAYLMSSSFVRRLLIYIRLKRVDLTIRKRPKYLKELLNTITTSTNVIYKHPYRDELVNEKDYTIPIYFEYLNFVNNKALGPIKKKKKGRLKRKISRKITLYNNILD